MQESVTEKNIDELVVYVYGRYRFVSVFCENVRSVKCDR